MVQTAITAAAVTATTAATTTTAAATINRPKEVGSKDSVEEEVDNKIRVGPVSKATMAEEEEEEGTMTVVGAAEEGTTVAATVVAGVEVVVAGATRTTVVFTGALEEINALNKICSAMCKTQASILTSTTTFP